ncbi:MAG: type II secretion system F family protein [Parcubacteria group bacterium]|nr:type II secretion system F family protein [Parcubacteria group bacterium]
MSLFSYTAVDQSGNERQGVVDAINTDVAIAALQRRGLTVSGIEEEKRQGAFLEDLNLFSGINNRDIVLLSRQITTLFEAQVSALRSFRLLASEARTPQLAEKLSMIADDIQSGSSISVALGKHPKMFSAFYVNLVRAGEEAGKLDETFAFLADYLDRNYEITQKARNALIYPAFVFTTFIVVMVLMMTLVIPRLAAILDEVGQNIPVYTRVVIGISKFMSDYLLLIVVFVIIMGFILGRFGTTERGKMAFARFRLSVPHLGLIYQQLFLSRVSDNLSTMLRSGIQMVRGLEVTSVVVGDVLYEQIMREATEDVKAGMPASEALRKHPEIPGMFVAMIKIGEETGNLSRILEVLSKFYRREVSNSIDTLVGLIEPFMIVSLALGVAFLLAAVLIPIYNISSGF